ncbi:MAG TPA: NADH-quinone oxidoreductase subunit L, partial [Pyrinomonadaceae bacterium]|nr:NADH-quinone oxidoreductase subunit L [Pyrinomonadaceae bacterium]
DNFVLMFVGWEGVGLCSYLLIGYYLKRKEAGDAAKKAFITNRVGDWGFLLGMMLTFFVTGSVSFFANPAAGEAAQTALSYFRTQPVEPFTLGAIFAGGATSIAILLFIGAIGKSAQIPLFVWLPDAMAGPTPVSALIHAATMVTAGVYMIVRCSEIFVHAPTAMFIVAVIGAATALFAATIGLAQNDIKKVLAYSTISQLGYMFLACGIGAFIAAIFHVITHAFFKALLFLGAGSVIHGMHHEQDMRRMGGLRKYMPITFATMITGWLAISGVPIFAGFFSKDEILWKTWSAALGPWSKVLWAVGAITALLTALYMTRMMVMTFWGEERFKDSEVHPHESSWVMTVPLIVLAILSTIGGFIGVPYAFANRDVNVIEHTLEPAVAKLPTSVDTDHADEHAEVGEERLLAVVSVVIALLGIGAGWVLFQRRPLLQMPRVLENKYYVDEIYDTTVIRPVEVISREGFWKIFDIGVIDGILHSIGDAVTEAGRIARYLQAGFVRAYAAIILVGALILIGLFAYFGFPLAR